MPDAPLQTLVLDDAGPVARVTLARPDVRNAIDATMIDELARVFRGLADRADVRAVTLTGHGTVFCAGADLTWMRSARDATYDENLAGAGRLADMLDAIDRLPQPVVARVNGTALGGGVGLVAVADVAIAAASASFSLSEVRLGLVPSAISPYVLRRITPAAARRYFVTAERFDAEEAKLIGLVHEVTADDLDHAVQRVLDAILAGGPEAVRLAKRIGREVPGLDEIAARDATTGWIAERRASAEGQEGMAAFLEKRRPSWRPDA